SCAHNLAPFAPRITSVEQEVSHAKRNVAEARRRSCARARTDDRQRTDGAAGDCSGTVSRRDPLGWFQLRTDRMGLVRRTDSVDLPEYRVVLAARDDLWRERADNVRPA